MENIDERKKIKLEVLGLLLECQNSLSKQDIASFLSYSIELIDEIIEELAMENRLPHFFSEINSLTSSGQSDQHDIWVQSEVFVQKAIGELAIIQHGDFKYWDPCIKSLLECSHNLGQTQYINIPNFMYNVTFILGYSVFFRINHDLIDVLVQNVVDYHQENNDKEQEILYSVLYFISLHNVDYPQDKLKHYLEELDKLSHNNSSNILLVLQGLLHYQMSEYDNVISLYKKYNLLPKVTPPILHELFCMYASTSALHLNNYHLSLGIMESYRNANQLTGKNAHALLWFVQLTFISLHTKNYEEVEKNINEIQKILEQHPNIQQENFYLFSYVFFSTQRALAYLKYIENEYELAYKLLSTFPNNLDEESVNIYPCDNPLIVKMLYALGTKRKTLQFELLILQRLDAMSPFLQGIVYRLLASDEKNEDKKIELFNKSLDCFSQINNKAEMLESALLYKNYLDLSGKKSELNSLQKKIDFHKLVTKEFEDNAFILLKNLLPNSYLCAQECAKIVFTNFNYFVNKLLEVLQQELEAQCVALIKVVDEKIIDFYQINISEEEQKEKSFQLSLKKIITDFQIDQKASVQYKKINEHTSAFYLRTPQNDWVLYLNTSFTFVKFTQMTQDESLLLGIFLSNKMHMANQISIFDIKNNKASALEQKVSPYFGSDLSSLIEKANLVATSDISVLIQGETGTGKEDLAKYIHTNSNVKGKFVAVQLSSITEQLIESTLFGSEKGAFTGAFKQQIGLLELSHNGTLFFDEVADIPLNMQVKLLRVLQEKKFYRVGGTQLIHSNFRILSATNKNLWEEVEAGRFREDLYYRLASVALVLPPIKDRPNDLMKIAQLYLTYYAKKYHKEALLKQGFSKAQKEQIKNHNWHGNIRELQSVVERFVIFEQLELISRWHKTSKHKENYDVTPSEEHINQEISSIEKNTFAVLPTLKEMEEKYIKHVLKQTDGKIYGKNGALTILDLSKSTLYKRMGEYNLK